MANNKLTGEIKNLYYKGPFRAIQNCFNCV